MDTTVKVSKETKERMSSLDFSGKNKTFDMIINDLVTFYQKYTKKRVKDYSEWEKAFKRSQNEWKGYEERKKKHEKELKEYDKRKDSWNRLLKWAKSQGFKG